jgi:gamma-glutamylcyclotransferase (GGCT)/AIG2-like uncharacterized protein YtfP
MKNLFIYGELKNKKKKKLTYKKSIKHDYIKGFCLKEIIILNKRYLTAYKCKSGIISGTILLRCKSFKKVDKWEGKHYKRILVKTKINKIKAYMYVEA